MVRSHAPGRQKVTVRAHYGALPSVAGRGRENGGEIRPDERCLALASRTRKNGPDAKRRRSEDVPHVAACVRALRFAAALTLGVETLARSVGGAPQGDALSVSRRRKRQTGERRQPCCAWRRSISPRNC